MPNIQNKDQKYVMVITDCKTGDYCKNMICAMPDNKIIIDTYDNVDREAKERTKKFSYNGDNQYTFKPIKLDRTICRLLNGNLRYRELRIPMDIRHEVWNTNNWR